MSILKYRTRHTRRTRASQWLRCLCFENIHKKRLHHVQNIIFSGAVVPLVLLPLYQSSWLSERASISGGYFHHFLCLPLSGTDKEETGWTDERARGLVQLCGEQQAHLHGKGETEGRAAVTLEVSEGSSAEVFVWGLLPAAVLRCWTGSPSQQRRRRGWTRSTLKSTWRVIRWG